MENLGPEPSAVDRGSRPGVTVAICTHNGAERLPATLQYLAAQKTSPDLEWEVLVIDNASSDDSAAVAARCWPTDAPARLKVAREPRLGLTHARERALNEARYEAVSFVDDDNRVAENWVQRVAEIMAEHSEVAICGGFSEAECELPPPPWFEGYQNYYAIGPVGARPGDVTDSIGIVWGAGLTMRKSVWSEMTDLGFRLLTTATGEDHELCIATRLAGWRIWLDDGLRLRHYLPAGRLSWGYFRKLQQQRSAILVRVDPYFLALYGGNWGGVRNIWVVSLLAAARDLARNAVRRPFKMLRRSSSGLEGDGDVVRFEWQLGRLVGLWRYRKEYTANLRLIERAQWRRDRRPASSGEIGRGAGAN